MTLKKRARIIVPERLRARRTANDNEAAKESIDKATRSNASRSRKPHKSRSISQTRHYYGLPEPSEFSKPGLLTSVMERFLTQDAAYGDFHHKVVQNGIVGRYQHSLDLTNNPEAFAVWKLEPHVLGLSRKPKCDDDICRALFRASHCDPKIASKHYKRIEHLWKARAPASAVAAFLATRKRQDPQRPKKKDDCDPNAAPHLDIGSADGGQTGVGNKVETPKASTTVCVENIPLALIADKQVGDFFILGGALLEKNNRRVRLQFIAGS